MASSEPVTFEQIGEDQWSETVQTPNGPLTGVGDSKEEAKHALDEMLAIAHAVAIARNRQRALVKRPRY